MQRAVTADNQLLLKAESPEEFQRLDLDEMAAPIGWDGWYQVGWGLQYPATKEAEFRLLKEQS